MKLAVAASLFFSSMLWLGVSQAFTLENHTGYSFQGKEALKNTSVDKAANSDNVADIPVSNNSIVGELTIPGSKPVECKLILGGGIINWTIQKFPIYMGESSKGSVEPCNQVKPLICCN